MPIPKPLRANEPFVSQATIRKHFQSYGRRYGVVQILNSGKKKDDNSVIYRVLLKCAKGNRKNKLVKSRLNRPSKKPKKVTIKRDCRVTTNIYACDKANPDGKQTFVLSKYSKHNYQSIVAVGLPYYRRLDRNDEFREFVATCRKNRVSPTIIHTLAKEQFVTKKGLSVDAVVLVLRDIYNEFAKVRSELIQSRTPINKVLELLADSEFYTTYEVDNNRLRYLFFAYPDFISIFRDNPYILIFDYTYKVYASGLPLLYFDFVTSLGIVLPLAYILIPDKTFDGY